MTNPVIGKKRKNRDEDLEAEDEKIVQKREVAAKMFLLTRALIDPLLDMTLDFPQKITNKMLRLRMCIEKALKRDELTAEEEDMLREAVERVRADVNEEDEGMMV